VRGSLGVAVGIALLALSGACSGDDDGAGASGSAAEAGKMDPGSGSGSGGRSGSAGAGAGGSSQAGTGASGKGGAGGTAGTAGRASAGSGASGSGGSGSAGQSADPGDLPVIGGCTMFSADDAWNQEISGAEVDHDWTDRLQQLVGDVHLHPDYGNSGSEHYGIPINVVPENQAKLAVKIDWYPEESDPGPYPFPPPNDVKIEGGTPEACDGDCHLLVVQQGACMLYEGYACSYDAGWHCGGEATWNLKRNGYGQRMEGWTSADAAGLAITPGLVRFDEVAAGEIRHAIRFTVDCTHGGHIEPASHDAVPDGCDANDPNAPPMGLRVRLRADYDLGSLSEPARVVARAMQRYGLILADNGSNFYFQGDDNPGWTEEQVEPLKSIPASAFEVIASPGL
jgi:hypothetical protein